jgi:hypothetical protein
LKAIRRFTVLFFVLLFVLSACSSAATPSPTQPPLEATALPEPSPTAAQPAIPTIREALPNLEYLIDVTSTGKAQLQGGYFEEESAPGSAAKTTVQLGDVQFFGDVNRDGSEDALLTLVVDPGGSGTFTYLVLVLNDNGVPRPVASVLLGDRILVKSLAIEPGGVKVSLLTRKPDEPMTADPTVEQTLMFKLLEGQLVEEK